MCGVFSLRGNNSYAKCGVAASAQGRDLRTRPVATLIIGYAIWSTIMTTPQKESFIFYRSFYEAIESLPDKDRLAIYDALCRLGLNQTDTKLDGIAECLFTLIRPQINANTKKWSDGKKGGRPKKKTTGSGKTKTTGSKNKKPKEEGVRSKEKGIRNKEKEKEYTNNFNLFWDKYANKVGSKDDCKEKLFKIFDEGVTMTTILDAIDRYDNHLGDNTWKQKRNPKTWLNQRGWLDEYIPPSAGSASKSIEDELAALRETLE